MKTRYTLLISLLIGIGAAHAQIPVTDGASIFTQVINQVESIAKWGAQYAQLAQQIEQAKQQIDQGKRQYEAVTGSRGMANLLNNQSLNSGLPTEWQAVFSSVKNTPSYSRERAKYPTNASTPKANELYDTIASQNASMSDFFKSSNDRLIQVKSLMAQIDSASDPAAKADLTNRLISEQNAIQANQQLFAALQEKQKQDLEAASRAATNEYRCREFKRKDC